MKKLLLILLATIAMIQSKGQTNYINVCAECMDYRSFDFNSPDDSTFYFFSTDTSQSDNIWQQGVPVKSVFTSGYYGPKAFVTDTLNPYPVNNISSFEYSIINCNAETAAQNCGGYWGTSMQVTYMIHSDDSIDGGTIEISHNGSPFINIIDDPGIEIQGEIYTVNDTIESLGKPGFSGNTDEWKFFYIWFSSFFGLDTVTLRFTFASDSIQTNKDGWLIGFISMGGEFEGIEKIHYDNLISVYPNPTSDELRVVSAKISDNSRVQILNLQGQVLYDNENFKGDLINIQQLPNGVYLLKYSDSKYFAVKKFVV
jgi:hypothetical protein